MQKMLQKGPEKVLVMKLTNPETAAQAFKLEECQWSKNKLLIIKGLEFLALPTTGIELKPPYVVQLRMFWNNTKCPALLKYVTYEWLSVTTKPNISSTFVKFKGIIVPCYLAVWLSQTCSFVVCQLDCTRHTIAHFNITHVIGKVWNKKLKKKKLQTGSSIL